MTDQELKEHNILCAEFIGGITKKNASKRIAEIMSKNEYWLPYFGIVKDINLKFDSDWNWIMYVKNKICQLNIVDEFNTQYDSVSKGYSCFITPSFINTFESIYSEVLPTEKEAVINIINKFLIWYKDYDKRN